MSGKFSLNNVPNTMKAMVLTKHGGFDALQWHESYNVPQPQAGEALIKVLACGINNTDINTRVGWYSKSVTEPTSSNLTQTADEHDPSWGGQSINFPRIQGADVCGQVIAVNSQDPNDQKLIGRRVMIETWLRDKNDPENHHKSGYFGSERDGGFAEYTTAPLTNVFTVDSSLSDIEIASFATSYVTAENMLNRAHVKAGDKVLVTGASGGVGSALVQLAKRRHAIVVGITSAAKEVTIKSLGADATIDRSAAQNEESLRTALHNAIGSGAIAGPIVNFDLRTLYLRDLTFTGATVVPRGVFKDLVGYIEKGEIKPLVAQSFPLAELIEAQKTFLAKAHTGNIVISI